MLPASVFAEKFSIRAAYIPQFNLYYTSIAFPLTERFQAGLALMQGNLNFRQYHYIIPEPVFDRSGIAALTQPSYIHFRTQIYNPLNLYGLFLSWKVHNKFPLHLKYYAGYHSSVSGKSDGVRWNELIPRYESSYLYSYFKIDLKMKSSYFHAVSLDYIYQINANWFTGLETGVIALQTDVKANVRYPYNFYHPEDQAIHPVSNIPVNFLARYLVETNLTNYVAKPIPFFFIFIGRRFD